MELLETKKPNSKYYKLHTKSALCKKWQENTLKKSETLKIIKLSKKNLNNLLKQTNKKPDLEEKMQIMSMLCLLLDSSIPLSTKKMFIDGAKNISPMVNFFKKVFVNFINKNINKKRIIEENNIIKNENLSKKGLLNWNLIEFFDRILNSIKNTSKNVYFFVNNINQDKNKGFKELPNTQTAAKSKREIKAIKQKDVQIAKTAKINDEDIYHKISKNNKIDIEKTSKQQNRITTNQTIQKILKEGSKSKNWGEKVAAKERQSKSAIEQNYNN